MITAFLLLWLLVPAGNAWLDRKGPKRNYLLVNTLRGIAAILHGVLLLPSDFTFKGLYQNEFNVLQSLAVWGPILLFQLSSFWILFDLLWNKLNSRTWDYYDRKEGDSGWVDRLFMWLGPKAHKAAKGLALILCGLSAYVIYSQRL